MATTIYEYRVYCTNESAYVKVWASEPPTTCPNNNTHTINSASTTITNKVSEEIVQVKEEWVPTGGNYITECREADIPAVTSGTVVTIDWTWPINLAMFNMFFVTTDVNTGDRFTVLGSPDTTVGALTANVNIGDTVINVSPTVIQYFKVGYIMDLVGTTLLSGVVDTTSGSPTVTGTGTAFTTELAIGNAISINNEVYGVVAITDDTTLTVSSNFVNNNSGVPALMVSPPSGYQRMGRVLAIDSVANTMTLENPASQNFSASPAPTYVNLNVCRIHDYSIVTAGQVEVGQGKIGGSYLPAGTVVRILYTNNNGLEKKLTFYLEYVY